MSRKRQQGFNADVYDVVFGDGRHEAGDGRHDAVGSRWCTFLVVAEALVVRSIQRRLVCVDRRPFAEPRELIRRAARRALEQPFIPVVEETRDAEEPVRRGDAAQQTSRSPAFTGSVASTFL
jgi:hypothetical protein